MKKITSLSFVPYGLLLLWISVAACNSLRQQKSSVPEASLRFVRSDTVLDRSSMRSRLTASEPHVVINRKNPRNLVGGSILDNVYRSHDGGRTWQHGRLQSPYGVFGDPVLVSDDEGRIYYFHLATGAKDSGHRLEGIVMQYSDDEGRTWSPGVLIGKNGTKQQDKPWVAIDRRTGRMAVAWTEFDQYGSTDPRHRSRIRISFSSDRGRTWTPAVTLSDTEGDCRDDDMTPEGAVPLFDNSGNVYVVWAYDGRIWFDRSLDGGKTWGTDRAIARQEAGWNFDIRGIYRANGLPNFLRDANEHFYVVFGDKSATSGGDIKLVSSTDRGQTWTPVRTLGPREKDQFFPAATFDESSGTLEILFYDRSRSEGVQTAVRLMRYDPLCGTVRLFRVNKKDFTPVKFPFFGDYIGIDTYRGKTACIWTEIHNGGTSVHVAVLESGSN